MIKKISYVILILFSLFSCAQNEGESKKSELVKRLEGIFYNKNFTTIPDRTFNVVDYGAISDGYNLQIKTFKLIGNVLKLNSDFDIAQTINL